MADRLIIQQSVADALVRLDLAEETIRGPEGSLDDLDPFAYAGAMNAADTLIDAMLPDEDEEAGDDSLGLRVRADSAEAAIRRIETAHHDDGFGHCVLCWEVADAMSAAAPAPMPCPVLRSIGGAIVEPSR